MKDWLVDKMVGKLVEAGSWVALAFVEHTVEEPIVVLELEEQPGWVGLE